MKIPRNLKNYFIIIGFLLQVCANAQEVVKGLVADKNTRVPISFSTIKFIHLPEGTFSDSNGMFEIPYSLKNDSLIISSIGYHPKTIALSGLSDTVFLNPKFIELSPVIIGKRKKIGTEEFGIKKVKSDFKWGPSGKGEEFAQKILINIGEGQHAMLKTIILQVKYFNPDKPVLLHIYSADLKTGLPGEELLNKNYLITKNNFKGNKVVVDIEKENLFITDKYFYVSFEWLGTTFYKEGEKSRSRSFLPMTTEVNMPLTYSRTILINSNQWFPVTFVFPNQKNPTNTIFSVKADIYK